MSKRRAFRWPSRRMSPGKRRKYAKRHDLLTRRAAERAGVSVFEYVLGPALALRIPASICWEKIRLWRDRSPSRARRRRHLQPAYGRRQKFEAAMASLLSNARTDGRYVERMIYFR